MGGSKNKEEKKKKAHVYSYVLTSFVPTVSLGQAFDLLRMRWCTCCTTLQGHVSWKLPCLANLLFVDSAGLVQVGEPIRGLQ